MIDKILKALTKYRKAHKKPDAKEIQSMLKNIPTRLLIRELSRRDAIDTEELNTIVKVVKACVAETPIHDMTVLEKENFIDQLHTAVNMYR